MAKDSISVLEVARMQTGLHTGELVGLRWEDIEFKNKKMKQLQF